MQNLFNFMQAANIVGTKLTKIAVTFFHWQFSKKIELNLELQTELIKQSLISIVRC